MSLNVGSSLTSGMNHVHDYTPKDRSEADLLARNEGVHACLHSAGDRWNDSVGRGECDKGTLS